MDFRLYTRAQYRRHAGRVDDRHFLAVLSIAVLLASSQSQAQPSYSLVTQNDDFSAYLLPSSIRWEDPGSDYLIFDFRLESKAIFRRPKTANGVEYSAADFRARASCKDATVFAVSVVFRNRKGESVESVNPTTPTDIPTPPGSLSALVLQAACGAAPAKPYWQTPSPRRNEPAPERKESTQSEPKRVKDERATVSGTGFVVDNSGKLLTNNHVVRDCSKVEIVGTDGPQGYGTVIARDVKNDLAIVMLATKGRAFASFRRTPIRSGEAIIALGFPYSGLLATDVNVSTGIVSATAGLYNDASKVQISAPVQPGNSGGPLLDSSGRVVGVVVEKLDALAVAKAIGDIPQNINFAIKGELAQLFLRSNGVSPKEALEAAKPASIADVVESSRAYTYLLRCTPGATNEARDDVPEHSSEPQTDSANAARVRRTLGKEDWCLVERDVATCDYTSWSDCDSARPRQELRCVQKIRALDARP